jgi:DNA-binding CsgD family transcriptional regulator
MTDSELAVVRLVADGLTNREVAERLYISLHTVDGHLAMRSRNSESTPGLR